MTATSERWRTKSHRVRWLPLNQHIEDEKKLDGRCNGGGAVGRMPWRK